MNEIISAKRASNSFELVSLKHNKKYGRHLVAKRDIKAGEIIMVVKPDVFTLNLNNSHAYCGHCFKTSWVTIPCDFCNWCMFCSEECKAKAWSDYHNIECSVIPYIITNQTSDYWKQLALRLVILAIKESGSITQLKENLQKIDKCKSKFNYVFIFVIYFKIYSEYKFKNIYLDNVHPDLANENLDSDQFQHIYSLSSDVSSENLEYHVDYAILTLLILVKSTKLFGYNTKFENTLDLLSNEDIIFIGSLLLRLTKISDINAHCVRIYCVFYLV